MKIITFYLTPIFLSFLLCLSINLAHSQQYNGKGANTPFKTLEAEDGTISGGATIRRMTSYPTFHTPEIEASGRAFAELKNIGSAISWVNNTGINSNTIVVRSCLPDSPTGGGIDATLNLYVDGVFRQSLELTSKYAWVYGGWTNNTPGPDPRRFYDEFRFFIQGSPIANGSTITLKKDADNIASFYYIDLIDLEEVGPPLTQPENSLSIIDFGATPNDGTDDTKAFNDCIAKCQLFKMTMWIPAGVFHTKGIIKARGITIAGAGMWHTTHYRIIDPAVNYRHKFELTDCNVKDLYMFAPATGRELSAGKDYGMTMNGEKGWIVENVWANNVSVGFWMSGINGIIRNCRSSSSWGDGINMNNASQFVPTAIGKNFICENNFLRGNQDDGIALNAQNGTGTEHNMEEIKIQNNTSICTIWANGLRIAGGKGTLVKDNYITDAADNNGIKLAIFGELGNPLESIDVIGNVIIRGTGLRKIGGGNGGIHITSSAKNVYLKDNIVIDSEVGFLIERCDVMVDNNTVINPNYQGFKIVSSAIGTAKIVNNKVTGLANNQKAFEDLSGKDFTVTLMAGNSWQTTPVELINYYAKKSNNQASIYWTTLTEKNNSHFTIERSSNGKHFNKLGKVTGLLNSTNVQQYEFSDKNPFTGTNYYRLIQYDLNGDSTDYGIKTVKFTLNEAENTSIYPNPSQGKFTISFKDSNYSEQINIVIQDITGKDIYNQLHTVQDGKVNINIHIPSGYYTLKATNNITGYITKKVLIQ